MTFSFLLQFLDPVVFPQGFFARKGKIRKGHMTIHLEDFAKNYGVHNSLQCLGPGDDEGIDRMPALVSEQDSDDKDMPALLNNCAV